MGSVVARDDLFEKAGERPRTEPLPASAFVASSPKAAAASAPASTPVVSTPAKSGRPDAGCVPVGVPGLLAAVKPTGRPLVINHWATWCDPCVDELPRLVRAAAGAGDTADFIGVSWDLFDHPGDPKKVAKAVAQFADSAGVGYASVLFTGQPAELFAALNLDFELIPQTLVLAADGRVVLHHKGILTDADVNPLLAAVKAAR